MYIFVYGTLKRAYKDLNTFTTLFHASTEWLSHAVVRGDLYLVDWYPALQLGGDNLVFGEIYRINSPALLETIDQYEDAIAQDEYAIKLKHRDPITSDYVRKRIHIDDMECWIYEYLGEVSEDMRLENGVFEMK